MKPLLFIICLCIALLIPSCAPAEEQRSLLVSLVVDGRQLTFEYRAPVTVAEFLRDAEVETGDKDRIDPPLYTQITDGMRVTVVRVREQTECERQEIPFRQRPVFNEGLQPGEELLAQAGQNGIEEICYSVRIEDGVAQSRSEISRVIVQAPQDELIYVAPTGELDPVPIVGTLAYISNGNAWLMRSSSSAKMPITTDGGLDQRVFSLSEDGRQLLFTRSSNQNSRPGFLNQLWYIRDTTVPTNPIQLVPEDVLYAEWVPGQPNSISYSTGEAQPTPPGWRAFNDLWLMRIDPNTGDPLSIRTVLQPSTGGLYGWWGTVYKWSPDGKALAWVQADGLGLVDLETGALNPLVNYPLFNTRADWSWRATVSWSPDASLILTTVHGKPIGNEPPEFSPVFNVAVADVNGAFSAEIVPNAGIWASPSYSPQIAHKSSGFPIGYIAYLQARDIANSINPQAEYDLVVADRDGSNARVVFPDAGQPGLTAPQKLAWSPDARQIAFIYQGNLWVVDVVSRVAHQLTLDGAASHPVWSS
ncbi:MAG: G5 domain-containing protein [Aggregatilineales bacterium]